MFITDKETLKNYKDSNRIWQGIPGIERTKKGRLFATFYSGSQSETFGNFVLLIKSVDDGKTWSEPIVAVDKPETVRYFDPCLWIDPLGRLWLFWATLPENSGVYAAICDNPDADELCWGEEFFIAPELMLNKPCVLSTGEWLFNVWVLDPKVTIVPKMIAERIYQNTDDTGIFIYKSLDGGKSFEKIGKYIPPNRIYDESMMVELKNGILMLLVRNKTGIWRSYSYDSGKTWSDGSAFEIPSPCSRFFIRRLNSGRLILINNSNPHPKRFDLTIHLSDDDGKTWSEGFVIDERSEVSYPDAVESEDGFIYVIYDRERGSHKKSLAECSACAREILMAKVTEEDIMAQKLINPNSRLKSIVSKLTDYNGSKDYYADMDKDIDQGICNILINLGDREKIVDKIMQYYLPSSAEMANIDIEKTDSLIKAILNDADNLEDNIKRLIKVLQNKDGSVLSRPLIDRITSYIKENISQDFAIEDLANDMGISVYYMCRLFKKITGISIVTYKNNCRIQYAKVQLYSTDKSISQIAQECGFNSQSYFVKIFREQEKLTPSEYRKRLTEKKK